MSSYEDVLKSLSEFRTLVAHITALGKIRMKTEDKKLVKGIDAVISQLQIAHTRVKRKSTPLSVEKSNIKAANVLITYCKQMVGTKKPEWQIMAERNGWAPKKT